jgi:hypothetical protein
MRGVILHAPGDVRVEERADPRIKPGMAIRSAGEQETPLAF